MTIQGRLEAALGPDSGGRPDAIELAQLRLEVGRQMVDTTRDEKAYEQSVDRFTRVGQLPEIYRHQLDLEALASGLLFHGALLVRGFFSQNDVARLRTHLNAPTSTEPAAQALQFPGVTPGALADLLAIYRASGWGDIVREYLGGWPVMNSNRIDVKREMPAFGLPWHQDGAYFGRSVRAVNVWGALSPVGADRPGLGIVPRRVDDVIGFGSGQLRNLDSQPQLNYLTENASSALADILEQTPEVMPHLDPGDALIFDELTLHRTGAVPWNAPHRDLARTWFFAPSRYPATGAPMAL